MMKLKFTLLIVVTFMSTLSVSAWEYNGRHGWPTQKLPKKVIICNFGDTPAEAMLAESLSGLAAQAVNEGKFGEMIWFDTDNPSYKKLYDSTLSTLGVSEVRNMNVWELAKYLRKMGVVKEYVLYKIDKPRANAYASHSDTDYSSNVATVYAGLMKAALIDESLVEKAHSVGLKMKKDARSESLQECFDKNKTKLNNHSALSVPPSVHNLRDYAIAHKLMLYADDGPMIDKILEWVKPLSPILGWGCGDEYDFTSVIARWGHYNTATNWCINLPIISSVAGKVDVKKIKEVNLNKIDFADSSSFHTFVMSDGDNVQWAMGDFIHSKAFFGNDDKQDIGLSWTLCPTNLSIVSPFTWNTIAEAKTPDMSIFEYGGGYQYPDLFAVNRTNRPELLREFARRINYHISRMGITIFGFICWDVSSDAAQEAFQIYAEEMPGLTGMLAVQYFPYELDGKIYWKTNKNGIDIPVVTSKYSIWNEVNELRPRAGTPEYIGSLISRDALFAQEKSDNQLDWTIVHAWSDFAKTSKITKTPAIGVYPVKAARELMIENVKPVSANELLWRIRMKYRPKQTKKLLN